MQVLTTSSCLNELLGTVATKVIIPRGELGHVAASLMKGTTLKSIEIPSRFGPMLRVPSRLADLAPPIFGRIYLCHHSFPLLAHTVSLDVLLISSSALLFVASFMGSPFSSQAITRCGTRFALPFIFHFSYLFCWWGFRGLFCFCLSTSVKPAQEFGRYQQMSARFSRGNSIRCEGRSRITFPRRHRSFICYTFNKTLY